MAQVAIKGVSVAGVCCAVPGSVTTAVGNGATVNAEEDKKIESITGVRERRIAPAEVCTSDLCFTATNHLLNGLGWDRKKIDILVMVTQTPDYLLPATSCTLQERLSLSTDCAVFDINLGCSGYVYGLWVLSSLMVGGNLRNGLLLAGDTISRICSPTDRATATLFGDAGTATALVLEKSAEPMFFNLGSDGTGWDKLIVPAGAFRIPSTPKTAERSVREGGNIRSDQDLFMNGAEIFTFGIKRVPPLVHSTLAQANWMVDNVDYFVFHQANQFMLEYLAKKIKIPKERFLLALKHYGNTSSASIPLAMNSEIHKRLGHENLKLLLAGFGVGYSWAAVALQCGPMFSTDIIVHE